ncbi:Biotin carboxylase [Anaerohalosphaera lusitana]|uniref:Biotin carboxylase n=1 Tax=Anaerohalosphaera lusitana TaxID=1936003 RepID=A0A1U9NHW2_9BACT|nr:acetyl-CoA carboxylase biotin carboxylase subunit [Anaerohalosphaera lusitana]AQT67532.1 Biotin carboxylase [Anaerohalosphaera lusitana]
MFSRILIANRGEIALRIIRACKELGVQSVAVYSEADKDAPYLKLADEAVCVGPANALESYLNIPRIISAAEITDVEAIHPGYGFLAENDHFAEVCEDCGIGFIGPSAESMRMLGDKVAAREIAKKAHVKTVPGSEGEIKDENEAIKLANKIGYPIILKAAAGGGGRGMRVVHNDISMRTAFQSAKAEAEASFSNGKIFIEKFIVQPRHVEVQVVADKAGNALHFFERDCTVQRRHQKLIEEAPCPVLDDKLREDLCKAAIKVVKQTEYAGAATVEFLLDKDKNFYFIEVNTRIQVEHPVTEMVTNQDLIKWQLKVASGQTLDIRQKDIKLQGSAIECRINAEDPDRNFAPSPGRIETFIPPGGPGVRNDTYLHQGMMISPYYDSMVCKLIVHQNTRAETISTMTRALDEFVVDPIKTTIPLCREIINHRLFSKNDFDTSFIEKHMQL